MNYSVQPPDFWRLYAQPPSSGGGGAPAPPPPPPPASYTQFGGTYQEPPEFVPSLASCGREQLYDERCLHEPPSGGGDADARGGGDADALRGWPTPQSELRRLAAEIRAGVARLLLACQAPSEHTRCVAQGGAARARARRLTLPLCCCPGSHAPGRARACRTQPPSLAAHPSFTCLPVPARALPPTAAPPSRTWSCCLSTRSTSRRGCARPRRWRRWCASTRRSRRTPARSWRGGGTTDSESACCLENPALRLFCACVSRRG